MTPTDFDAKSFLPASDWLSGPAGAQLLLAEAAALREALDSVFGDDFVHIGPWGAGLYPEFARTRRHSLIADRAVVGASAVMRLDNLAVQSDSVDAVLLPHALEMAENPHALLREVDRILRPDGYVITLGFNPYGFWGLRHMRSRRRFPPDTRRLIPEGRLCDWLRLLNYSVQDTAWYHYRLPIMSRRRDGGNSPTDSSVPAADSVPVIPEAANDAVWRSGWRRLRTWPPLAACYLSVARKEMYSVTPLRTSWRRPRRMVGGLVNPTPRNVA